MSEEKLNYPLSEIVRSTQDISREKLSSWCDAIFSEENQERKSALKEKLLQNLMDGAFDRGVIDTWLEHNGKIPIDRSVHLVSKENYRRLVEYIAGDVDELSLENDKDDEPEVEEIPLDSFVVVQHDSVFLRTDPKDPRRIIKTGSGVGVEIGEMFDRISQLAKYLQENQIKTVVHIASQKGVEEFDKLKMVRKAEYVAFYLPDLQKIVFVCDQRGNSIFVVHVELLLFTDEEQELYLRNNDGVELTKLFGNFLKDDLKVFFDFNLVSSFSWGEFGHGKVYEDIKVHFESSKLSMGQVQDIKASQRQKKEKNKEKKISLDTLLMDKALLGTIISQYPFDYAKEKQVVFVTGFQPVQLENLYSSISRKIFYGRQLLNLAFEYIKKVYEDGYISANQWLEAKNAELSDIAKRKTGEELGYFTLGRPQSKSNKEGGRPSSGLCGILDKSKAWVVRRLEDVKTKFPDRDMGELLPSSNKKNCDVFFYYPWVLDELRTIKEQEEKEMAKPGWMPVGQRQGGVGHGIAGYLDRSVTWVTQAMEKLQKEGVEIISEQARSRQIGIPCEHYSPEIISLLKKRSEMYTAPPENEEWHVLGDNSHVGVGKTAIGLCAVIGKNREWIVANIEKILHKHPEFEPKIFLDARNNERLHYGKEIREALEYLRDSEVANK